MNLAHAHLVLNHVPVVGIFFAVLLYGLGIFRRSTELKRAALLGFVLVALLTIPAFLTGEPAEDAVEHLPGINKATIHNHEEAADISFWVLEGLGVFALAGLVLYRGASGAPRWFTAIVLVFALLVAGMMAWTANLGGQIHHPEITAAGAAAGEHHEKD